MAKGNMAKGKRGNRGDEARAARALLKRSPSKKNKKPSRTCQLPTPLHSCVHILFSFGIRTSRPLVAFFTQHMLRLAGRAATPLAAGVAGAFPGAFALQPKPRFLSFCLLSIPDAKDNHTQRRCEHLGQPAPLPLCASCIVPPPSLYLVQLQPAPLCLLQLQNPARYHPGSANFNLPPFLTLLFTLTCLCLPPVLTPARARPSHPGLRELVSVLDLDVDARDASGIRARPDNGQAMAFLQLQVGTLRGRTITLSLQLKIEKL
eukprot:366383-Chlamydomonas_euryale.AAC.4